MKLSFLQPLFTRPGPWASAYLDTSRDVEDPDRVIARRWRHLRDDLTAHGADPATVHALHAAVGTDDDLPGRHGQALFATRGELVLAEELPEPPVRDTAGLETLPDALPLVVQRAPDVPYLELFVGRTEDGDGIRVAARTGRWPAGRPDPDPAVRQTVPVEDWPLTAPQLAGDLSDLADRGAAEVLVLGRDPGDPRTAEVLVHHMPERLRSDLVTVGTARPGGTPGQAPLEELLARELGGRLNAADRACLEAYRVQRSRDRTACEGTAAVVGALRGARAAAVLVNDPPPSPGCLWAGPEEPAGATLLRAAACSGAELVVVPRGTLALDDGVGVLLRRSDPGT
ncbi:hypothetical protein OIE69_39870 [Actinacidiphila glaucinigra]|uniref:baeRF2 domain-containing protein n=1 Tax=Actinacidiphila glaucinigra TaxID=235986 RepID=UPI002DDA95DD|nr:hypothetical protein [Actinacidiphila glaucinigra]WSD64621.1 hypothetical protein OIE69_39870 [Actinacidiphila glaucinigra]